MLEDVEVTARREALRVAVSAFVSSITRVDGANVARWRDPICPWVAGLGAEHGEFMATRIRAIAKLVGARSSDDSKCDSNLLVFLTDQPAELIGQLNSRHPRLFAGGIDRFVDSARPVLVWQSSPLQNADGSTPITGPDKPPEFRLRDSRIISGVREELAAVIVVVDTRSTGLATFGQLADYVAMVALAKLDTSAEIGDAPSILQLFADQPPDPIPRNLTSWDEAFLKSVYGMRDSYLQETGVISTRMMQQLDARD